MRDLRIHYLQHVPFEGLGYIENWAKAKNYILTSTKFYENWTLPNIEDFDWLIIMGGPMGVYQEDEYSWLKAEKQFIKAAIKKNKVVIGICLGSQLIAEALGAKVYPNTKKEIGWFPVSLTENKLSLTDNLPKLFEVLHWHGDTFDLPKGAIHLMQTDVCKHQAFIYKDRVIGLQFHLESTPESLKQMITNCRHELIADDFVQTEEDILRHIELCEQTNIILNQILDHFISFSILNKN